MLFVVYDCNCIWWCFVVWFSGGFGCLVVFVLFDCVWWFGVFRYCVLCSFE